MYESNKDAESRSKHTHARTRGVANFQKIHDPLSLEAEDFGEEYDVFTVELHARGVHLKTITIGGQALVEGFHGEHLAAFRAGGMSCQ